MTERPLDAIAVGTCYVDTNVNNFPFSRGQLVGEEIIGERYEVVPGSSAVNFCRLGGALGLRTAFIGMTGTDPNGEVLGRLLEEQGVQSNLVQQPELLTNVSFNLTNPQGEHIMFVAGTANAALTPEAVLPKLQELMPQSDILYLGGCLKLAALAPAYSDIADLAKRHDTKIVVDHGRVPAKVSQETITAVKELVLGAAYYFPSHEEFCTLWEVPTIEDGLRELQTQAPDLTVVVKDGANGAFYWSTDAVRVIGAPQVDHVVNATGAGDSFNAGVMTALSRQRSLAEAISYGCKVAAAQITAKPLPPLER